MHIPENYLSPVTCAVMTGAIIPVWVHAVKRIKLELPKEKMPMLGVGAAFSFLAMMFNVPLLGGTTGHAVGGTLVALLFGPNAACICVSIALLLQAVIFGDGGILSFGANCFNMAFVLPYLGYAIYKLTCKLLKKSKHRKYIAAAIGSYIGLNAAALCAATEFGIQPIFFTDRQGMPLYCPYDLSISIPAMMSSHLLIAGFVEAIFTVVIFAFVQKTEPSLIFENQLDRKANIKSNNYVPIFALLAILIVLTPLGLLAVGTAWGEWDSNQLNEMLSYIPSKIQNGWSFKAILSDYSLQGANEVIIYMLSAVIGVALLVIIFRVLSKAFQRKSVN